MPVSLRCKIKHLCYNGTLNKRERDRLLYALDSVDAWDKVKADIDALYDGTVPTWGISGEVVMRIIDKHLQEVKEDENC